MGRRMHPGEVATDVALVRRLLRAQLPEWAGLPVRPVASAGTDNALYRLGDEMVVRLPRIHWAVEQVHTEQVWLPRLAPHLPVSVPAPLAKGAPGEGYQWPWSVYRWLPGQPPAVGRIRDPASLATDLGRFVAALHGVDAAGGPPPTSTRPRRPGTPPWPSRRGRERPRGCTATCRPATCSSTPRQAG